MDQSFDGIANKFNRNIYGTAKGRVRHAVLTDLLARELSGSAGLQILDLGGGTGEMAKVCLQWGHAVDVVDVSDDVLGIAKQQLGEFADVRFFTSSLQAFTPNKQYDVVICHAVLEWLNDPLAQLPYITRHLKADGLLSLSVFNRDAAVFGNMAYGNFDYVEKGLKVKKQVRLNPSNSIYPKDLLAQLSAQHMTVSQKAGVRCFLDYVKRTVADEEIGQLIELEKQYCRQEPYLWLGKYFHVFARHSASPFNAAAE